MTEAQIIYCNTEHELDLLKEIIIDLNFTSSTDIERLQELAADLNFRYRQAYESFKQLEAFMSI